MLHKHAVKPCVISQKYALMQICICPEPGYYISIVPNRRKYDEVLTLHTRAANLLKPWQDISARFFVRSCKVLEDLGKIFGMILQDIACQDHRRLAKPMIPIMRELLSNDCVSAL